MTVLVLNTHDAVKRLVKSGQSEETAEAIVELVTDVHEHVATKSDLMLLKSDLTLLKSDLKSLEDRLTVKLYTVGMAIAGLLAAFNYFG